MNAVLVIGKDDAEPTGGGAVEGLTTAQHNLVRQETPPQ